jgi:hypothetical protein
MSTKDATKLAGDGVHGNDESHQELAEALWKLFESSGAFGIQQATSQSPPTTPVPSEAVVIALGNVGTTIYSGTTAQNLSRTSGGVNMFRTRHDLRRAVEWRAVVFVQTNATNIAARLRAMYSIDGGTTWLSLGKRPHGIEPADGDTDVGADLLIGSNGGAANTLRANTPRPSQSAWWPLPPEAVTDDTWLTFRNVQGTTTGTQVLESLAFQFR